MRKSDKKNRAKKLHKKQKATVTIRNHKDTIFRMIFKNKRELLILYNAADFLINNEYISKRLEWKNEFNR